MTGIREGQRVNLIFDADSDSSKTLGCFVKVLKGERLHISLPGSTTDFNEYLQEGCEARVNIFTPAGITVFDSVVLDSPHDSVLIIEYDDNNERIQRRSYVRAEFYAKMLLESPDFKNVQAQTLDIGGGGVKFICEKTLYLGETVTATIYLPGVSPAISLQGTIIKHQDLSDRRYVLVFTSIAERDRDKIIKLCFEELRKAASA